MKTIIFTSIGALIVIIAILTFCFSSYIKAPPDMAFIISGARKKPKILIGQAGFRVPFFERVDKVPLGAIQIDVKTSSAVPTAEYINVNVDSNVNVKVGEKSEQILLAAQNFLNFNRNDIANKVKSVLEGNIREIVGQMKLTDMVSDRKAFSAKVQENAVPDLLKFGLDLIAFNVQNFVDDNGVIDNLGIDNVEQIRKNAAIAKSDAKREIAIAEAENAKVANDAKVKAAEEIAARNNDLDIKRADLKKISDTKMAQAEIAKGIELENQRKLKEVAATNADIARTEKESELKQKQIELKEHELTAEIRKKADAEKYAIEQSAEADRISRQNEADANRYEREKEAEARSFSELKAAETKAATAIKEAEALRAESDAKKYAALSEAEGIKAIGEATAQAIREKAEAQKIMGEASLVEMYFNVLPQIVANAAEPLSKVDKITLYGEGNQTKIIKDVMTSADQIMNAVSESTGINIKDIVNNLINK